MKKIAVTGFGVVSLALFLGIQSQAADEMNVVEVAPVGVYAEIDVAGQNQVINALVGEDGGHPGAH